MTEKRFMVDDAGTLIDMQTRDTFDYVSEVVGLLNSLAEENKTLLHTNGKNEEEIECLSEENEQLKSQIEHLKVKLDRERNATTKQHRKWDKEVQEKINELQQENKTIKDTIKQAYNTERTQLGRSVLKQLYEAIQ